MDRQGYNPRRGAPPDPSQDDGLRAVREERRAARARYWEEVLRAFPKARIIWQDYSRPMRDQAQRRLARYEKRLSYVVSDLLDASWGKELPGPFELIVSGIALHNLRDRKAIFRCYDVIRGLLAPAGCFLDYDYFQYAGGLDLHLAAMRDAGFASAECVWQEGAAAIVKAA
jgi:hypothetical protein